MKTVEEAIKFRRAMQEFDATKEIAKSDLELILNAGRLAPSALGAEPTRVLVIKNKDLKEEIAKSAYNQMNVHKIETADSLLLLTSVTGDVFKSRENIKFNLQRRGLNEQDLEATIDGYAQYLSSIDCDVYSANQAYITLGYMSIQAAALDVESVIIQGFDPQKLNNFLHDKGLIDKNRELVHVSMAIGYSNEEIRSKLYPQLRISEKDFFEIIE